jgi:hypothetical protein
MHNSPAEQIDDWGAWALDFGAVIENGDTVLFVGHNGPNGEDTWTDPRWGKYLEDFLESIRDTRSMRERYRPVFIYLEKKTGQNWPKIDISQRWTSLVEDILLRVFGRDNIFGPADLVNGWPTVPELAGKVIPVCITDCKSSNLIFSGDPSGLTRVGPPGGFDVYTDSTQMAAQKGEGEGIILASDQYQDNWSFSLCSPPNPLYVKPLPLIPNYMVINAIGHPCGGCTRDPHDINCVFFVNRVGTFRFPYRTVLEAYNRGKDFPGWTILINPGNYRETMVMDKTVTLKADGGTVIIGR